MDTGDLAPDRFPMADGLLSRVATVASVADNAAEQAGVSGGNAVVPVEIQLRQAGHIDPRGLAPGEAGQEAGVQAVNAFEDDELAPFKLHHVPGFAAAKPEVKAGQLDFLPRNQLLQVGLQAGGVQGAEGFKLIGAPLVFRSVLAVEEVIVQFERERRNPLGEELNPCTSTGRT